LPDDDGIKLMGEIKISYPNTPVILMTGYSDVNTAVESNKKWCFRLYLEAFNPDEVLIVIANALENNVPELEKNQKSKLLQLIMRNLFKVFQSFQKCYQST
jgi:two-component system response regulator HydG